MSFHTALTTPALIALAAVAAFVASKISLPLPYLLGPLLASAFVATALPQSLPDNYIFPIWLRMIFIAAIGLMIGAQVTPKLFADIGRLSVSLIALIGFVIIALCWNYAIFRRIGGYDRATAFYSSTPGGLYESIAMGEEAGAHMPRLILQQFLRIIIVVTLLPIGLSLWIGEPVGSAGGMTLSHGSVPLLALPGIFLAGIAGLITGRYLRLPAGQLTGPMTIAALLALTGWKQQLGRFARVPMARLRMLKQMFVTRNKLKPLWPQRLRILGTLIRCLLQREFPVRDTLAALPVTGRLAVKMVN